MLFDQGALQYDRWRNHHGFSTVQYFKIIKHLLGTTVDAMRPNQQMLETPMILSAGAVQSSPDVIAELLCTFR